MSRTETLPRRKQGQVVLSHPVPLLQRADVLRILKKEMLCVQRVTQRGLG